jgi:hypothetical protein
MVAIKAMHRLCVQSRHNREKGFVSKQVLGSEPQEVRAVALAQPHRCGSDDWLLESPLGRFVRKHGLRQEVYDAAREYGRAVARVFFILGVPWVGKYMYSPCNTLEAYTTLEHANMTWH